MTKKEIVAMLFRSVEEWNKWRRENPDILPNLSESDLRMADLRMADLRMANLRGADLRGANLRMANLRGADWQSHDLISKLLFDAAGQSVERRMIAGLILISRDWCWDKFLRIDHPEKEWAFSVLREHGCPHVPAAPSKENSDEDH